MFVYCCIIVFAFQSQCETGLIKLRSGWEQGWGAAPELGALMGSAFGGTRADEDDACINDRLCPLKGKSAPHPLLCNLQKNVLYFRPSAFMSRNCNDSRNYAN